MVNELRMGTIKQEAENMAVLLPNQGIEERHSIEVIGTDNADQWLWIAADPELEEGARLSG